MEQTTMEDAKKSNRREQHKLLDRHPILGFILLILWVEFFIQLGAFVAGIFGGAAEAMGYAADGLTPVLQLVSVGLAFLALLIHKRWFRPEFSGCLTRKNFRMGLVFCMPRHFSGRATYGPVCWSISSTTRWRFWPRSRSRAVSR